MQVDGLDVVGVHGGVGQAAGHAQAFTDGRRLKDLAGTVAAVEHHGVGAALAFDRVAAVAGIPLEGVSTDPQEGGVIPLLPVDEVLAVTADQQIGPIAAEQRVPTGPTVDGESDEAGQVPVRREAVVASVGDDVQRLGTGDVDGERLGLPTPANRTRATRSRVAAKISALALRRDLDAVDAWAALVDVGVVALVPEDPVVVAFAEALVVAVAAAEGVVLAAAEQTVSPCLAGQGVVPSLPEELVRARAACERVLIAPASQVGRGRGRWSRRG